MAHTMTSRHHDVVVTLDPEGQRSGHRAIKLVGVGTALSFHVWCCLVLILLQY